MSDSKKHDRFLLDFHRAYAGVTSRALGGWRDGRKRSSYRRLAEEARDLDERDLVVDLGCGDGLLMEELRLVTEAGIAGIDMSPEEILAARGRLGEAADLRCERAQGTTLANESASLILSHIAIGLMRPVEPVFREIARILKSGGTFRFHINRGDTGDPVCAVFLNHLRALRKEEGVWGWFLGDRRVYDLDGFASLIETQPDLAVDPREESFDLWRYDEPVAVWDELKTYYDVALLSKAGKRRLRERTLRDWQPFVDAFGKLRCGFAMRSIGCRKV